MLYIDMYGWVCVCVCVQSCEKDSQCGGGMCCAVSLWIRSLRMCMPMGLEGEECHPMSHKVKLLGFFSYHSFLFLISIQSNTALPYFELCVHTTFSVSKL